MTQPPGLPPRRRLSWARGHKRLTAGIAAFGLLAGIAAIVGATGIGTSAFTVADPGPRSITSTAKAGTGATAKASTGAAVKPGTGAPAKPGRGASAKAGTGASAKAGTGSSAPGGANAGTGTGAGGGAPGTPPAASDDCSDQARAWLNGGSSQQIAALEGAFGALDAAGNALVAAAGHGAHREIPAVEGAAGALQSAAGAVEANPGPACVPGLRANLMSGAADFSQVAGDAESAVGALEDGQVGAAEADVDAARPLVAEASGSIAAAEAAANSAG